MSVEALFEQYSEMSSSDQERFLLMVGNDDELSEEWRAEIDRRWEAYKSGKVEPIDGMEMERRLASKYGLQL